MAMQGAAWLFEKVSKMRGAKRAGAGRKPNVPNRASANRERAAAASGATPLDVMLKSMRLLLALADESATTCRPKTIVSVQFMDVNVTAFSILSIILGVKK